MSAAVLTESAWSMSPETIDALAWTLLHFVWQGALLGCAAFFALRVVRPERSTTRYAIGVVTLALMLAATAVTFTVLSRPSLPVESTATTTSQSQFTPAAAARVEGINSVLDAGAALSSQSATTATRSWPPSTIGPLPSTLVVAMWAVGVLALSLRLLGGWMLTRRLTRHAIAAVSPAVNAAAKTIADRLQLRRAVLVVESGAVIVPTLIGYVKPVVLLPAVALTGLTPDQLNAILAHELAHVRRHDYLINLLQSIVETLLFYHPATWWVSAQVRAEREHCCDDLAVDVCGDRLVYVSALAELTSIASHRAFALAATDGSLLSRVQRLLGRPRASHEPAPAWALLVLFVLLAGSAGSFSASSPAAEPTRPGAAQVDTDLRTHAINASPVDAAESRTSLAVSEQRRRVDAERAIEQARARADADARSEFDEEYQRRTEVEQTLREQARVKAEADALRQQTWKEAAEHAAFFSSQWFRGFFDAPVAPQAPPAPPAPQAPAAPQGPPALSAPHAPQAPQAP
ncbi:MAG TPA: M56 family metallopeptidase, partial [Vicinamibacterales bacterium]|nr:M56 family metallopeptidase [Vicinamibacterales bacterium]